MKILLRIPAILLLASAAWTYFSYDEYLSVVETLLPFLNITGMFFQALNFFLVVIQISIGSILWSYAGPTEDKGEA